MFLTLPLTLLARGHGREIYLHAPSLATSSYNANTPMQVATSRQATPAKTQHGF